MIFLEAASGFEPLNKGFADLCLTTWLRRLNYQTSRHAVKTAPAHNGAPYIQFFTLHVNDENSIGAEI